MNQDEFDFTQFLQEGFQPQNNQTAAIYQPQDVLNTGLLGEIPQTQNNNAESILQNAGQGAAAMAQSANNATAQLQAAGNNLAQRQSQAMQANMQQRQQDQQKQQQGLATMAKLAMMFI